MKQPLVILVLEDEKYRQIMIEPLLREHYSYWAKTANEALALLESRRFDLILLDHDLGKRACGCVIANHLAQENCLNHKTNIIVHSVNPKGIKRMMKILNQSPSQVPVFSLPTILPDLLLTF